jgi:hypothetical protein
MEGGARSPEELDELLEDAFVTRDPAQLGVLFDAAAVLAPGDGAEARGADAAVRATAAFWRAGGGYVGGARRVVRAGDAALVVAAAGIHVARRRRDGWRLAISLLDPSRTREEAPWGR